MEKMKGRWVQQIVILLKENCHNFNQFVEKLSDYEKLC